MTTPFRIFALLFALEIICTLCGYHPLANAQQAEQQAQQQAQDAQIQQARELFMQGVQQFDDRDYEAARKSFARAYELKKHPAVLLNLGQCELRVKKYVDAATHLSQYLDDNPGATAQERKLAEQGLKEARKHTARLRVTVEPLGSEVIINGKSVGKAPFLKDLDVAPGTVTVEAIGEDGTTKKTSIFARVGQISGVLFDLYSTAEPSLIPDKPRPTTETRTRRKGFFNWVSSDPIGISGMTLTGLGLVTVAVGATGHGITQHIAVDHENALISFYNQKLGKQNVGGLLNANKIRITSATRSSCPTVRRLVDSINNIQVTVENYPNFKLGNYLVELCDDIDSYYNKRDKFKTVWIAGTAVTSLSIVGTTVAYFLRSEQPVNASDTPSRHTPNKSVKASVVPVANSSMQGLFVVGSF